MAAERREKLRSHVLDASLTAEFCALLSLNFKITDFSFLCLKKPPKHPAANSDKQRQRAETGCIV